MGAESPAKGIRTCALLTPTTIAIADHRYLCSAASVSGKAGPHNSPGDHRAECACGDPGFGERHRVRMNVRRNPPGIVGPGRGSPGTGQTLVVVLAAVDAAIDQRAVAGDLPGADGGDGLTSPEAPRAQHAVRRPHRPPPRLSQTTALSISRTSSSYHSAISTQSVSSAVGASAWSAAIAA